MSSIRRSNSVTRACFLDVLGRGRFTNEKSGFSAHSLFFGSSREPDEDGADIGGVLPTGKRIRRISEPSWRAVVSNSFAPARAGRENAQQGVALSRK
jgi:hypothetical protein